MKGRKKMYKCDECGNLFEDGEEFHWREKYDSETPFYVDMAGCPLCHGSYTEIYPCKICGSYNHDADEFYCDNCKKDVQESFKKLIDDNFTEEERILLNELYDGKMI